jgi:heme-degrading monooxygenase HmoA
MSEDPIITIFRNRLRPDADGYPDEAARMTERAKTMPGFIEAKQFTAQDGERVTIVAFDSLESQRNWGHDPEHRVAQERGRQEFYSTYRLQVCRLLRESSFEQPGTNPGPEALGH